MIVRLHALIFLSAVTLLSSAARADNSCHEIFKFGSQSEPVRGWVLPDGYAQWLLWEQTANLAQYKKSPDAVKIGLVPLAAINFKIEKSAAAPDSLIRMFKQGKNVLWPKHPFNTHVGVPYLNEVETSTIEGFLTSSRSIALKGPLRGYTVKLATDHPHGLQGEYQPGKINTNDDIHSALLHTEHIEEVDREIGPDPVFSMMPEIMTLAEKKTGIGMIVRDVRILEDGHYYLPALSIPFVGRKIAQINHSEFGPFFEKYYASVLGEAKARLLLRYGLQMETPNPQNMLVQFDREMRPTGRIIFRDVSDAFLVDAVATGLDFNDQIAKDTAADYKPESMVKPYWSNSAWRMDEAGVDSVGAQEMSAWGAAHNRAFVEFIEKELDVRLIAPYGVKPSEDELRYVYDFFKSDIGQKKLREYRASKSLRRENGLKRSV